MENPKTEKDNELEDLSLILTNTFKTEDFDATEELLAQCNSVHACKVCDEVFRTKKDLVQHMRDSYDCRTKKIFRCVECQQVFRTVGKFQLHLLFHSQEKEEPQKQSSEADITHIFCELCGKDFNSGSQKKKHLNSHFEQHGSVLCPTCGKCLCSKEMYIRHSHIHEHLGVKGRFIKDSKKKKVTCKICNKTFSTSSTLRDHLYLHTGDKPFECSSCKKLFSTKGSLKTHQKLHFKSEVLSDKKGKVK